MMFGPCMSRKKHSAVIENDTSFSGRTSRTSATASSDFRDLPGNLFWKDAFRCKGCSLPLEIPIFLCYNPKETHPLCKSCSKCAVPGCGSLVGTTRSLVLEKLVSAVKFSCEYRCGKMEMDAVVYRAHIASCYCRPLPCKICGVNQRFTSLLAHLKTVHGVKESQIDQDALMVDFHSGQPRMQYLRFGGELFLLNYYKDTIWIEILSMIPGLEKSFGVRVSGCKYPIETELRVLNIRNVVKPWLNEKNSLEKTELQRNKYVPFNRISGRTSLGSQTDSEASSERSLSPANSHLDRSRYYMVVPQDEELIFLFYNTCNGADEDFSLASLSTFETEAVEETSEIETSDLNVTGANVDEVFV